MGFLTFTMEPTDCASSQVCRAHLDTQAVELYLASHRPHHMEEEEEIHLGRVRGARVDINPTGWKVMSRWDGRKGSIKLP